MVNITHTPAPTSSVTSLSHLGAIEWRESDERSAGRQRRLEFDVPDQSELQISGLVYEQNTIGR